MCLLLLVVDDINILGSPLSLSTEVLMIKKQIKKKKKPLYLIELKTSLRMQRTAPPKESALNKPLAKYNPKSSIKEFFFHMVAFFPPF